MSYDGTVMRAVSLELDKTLKGARIDRIYQPTRNELLLLLKQQGCVRRLLLSAAAQEAGVYFTSHPAENPAEPPLFCMVLRKHLEGGRVLSCLQRGLERVMEITCEAVDELGETARRVLVIEIMGKHSNIILVDPDRNAIIDAIRRVPATVSRYRQVLPGLPYQPPPPQDKTVPWEVDHDGFCRKLFSYPLNQDLNSILLAAFSGFGPQTVSEIVCRSGLEDNTPLEYCGEYEIGRLWRAFSQVAHELESGVFSPEVAVRDQTPLAFSAIPMTRYPAEWRRRFDSISEAADFYFHYRKAAAMLAQKKNDLLQVVRKETLRCEKKAGLLLDTIREAEECRKFQLWGELLVAHIHSLRPGKEAEVVNYYDPDGRTVNIPLNESLSIIENAQRYFQKYRKSQNAARQAVLQHEETSSELEYLASIASALDNAASVQDLDEIKAELQEAGYIKTPPSRANKTRQAVPAASLPPKVIIDGWEVYLGKNNRQNDLLVTRIARPDDIWLHTRNIPGAHVLVKNQSGKELPPTVLEKAALLAAYHSRARLSANVPVDYTLRKHVWKTKGARPGMVRYQNQQTIHVTATEEKIKAILDGSLAPLPGGQQLIPPEAP